MGCGVSKDDYQAVVDERDSALAELQSVKAELQSVKGELSTAKSSIQDYEQKVAKVRIEAEMINGVFVPVLKGTEGTIDPTDFLFKLRDNVEGLNDAVLKEKFDAVMDSEGGSEELNDFFLYLFEDIPKTLQ